MSYKANAGWLLSCLMLTACGGGSDTDSGEGSGPFIRFTVNGVNVVDGFQEVRVKRRVISVAAETLLDPCNSTQFQNAAAVETAYPEYCAEEQTRLSESILFNVQFFNGSNQDSLTLNYTGQGYTIRIYEYDDMAPDNKGVEVWNSDYFAQAIRESEQEAGSDVGDYDPLETNSVVLGPAEAFPNQSSGYTPFFAAERNVLNPNALFSPSNMAVIPSRDMCLWNASFNGGPYEKVICLYPNLLPTPVSDDGSVLHYIASVSFNFNDWTDQPDDFHIYVEPE